MSDIFTFSHHKLLFWRVGPINSQKQTHWGIEGTHQPPTKRGIWAFPYPYFDYFFVIYWKRLLPKKFQGKWNDSPKYESNPELLESDWVEYEKTYENIMRQHPGKKFYYDGPFYSHISIHGSVDYSTWFYWDSAKMWAEEAKKHITWYERARDRIYKFEYAKDHLEVFIPNY